MLHLHHGLTIEPGLIRFSTRGETMKKSATGKIFYLLKEGYGYNSIAVELDLSVEEVRRAVKLRKDDKRRTKKKRSLVL